MRLRRCATVFTATLLFACGLSRVVEGTDELPAGGRFAARSDPQELEAFLDPFYNKHIRQSEFPSAAVVVVKDGKVLLEKGYGYVNIGRTKLVTPDNTIFFAASVSKLFTATAVMQLVEKGKIDLARDVNEYLSEFKIGTEFVTPVTVGNLLTHTAGFDEHMLGAELPIAGPVVTLENYFASQRLRRVRPPGDQFNYSSHGMALAGYLVEKLSGMPFYDYVEENIFVPLGMEHSSFRQPVPYALTQDLAIQRFSKAQMAVYPAGTLVSTVSDMARFMMAHLNGGRFGRERILSEASIALMHSQHYAAAPGMPGAAYGFFECFANRERGLFHTGARDHQSLLYLDPARNLGLYTVISGTDEEGKLNGRVLKAFLNHYFPSGTAALPPPAGFPHEAQQLAGLYRMNIISQTTVEKLPALLMDVRVSNGENGHLFLAVPGHSRNPKGVEFIPKAESIYESSDGGYLTFRKDADGRVTNLFFSGFLGNSLMDPTSFSSLSWWEAGKLHLAIAIVGCVTFVSFVLRSAFTSLLNMLRPRGSIAGPNRVIGRLAWHWAIATAMLLMMAPLVGVLLAMSTTDHQLYSIPPILRVVLRLLFAAAILSAAVPFFAIAAWKCGFWSLSERVHYSAVALAALLLIPFLSYWNLLGWHF